MIIKKQINIQASTDAEALQIAKAMEQMSGHFTAKEWQAIAKKLQNKMNRTRIKLIL